MGVIKKCWSNTVNMKITLKKLLFARPWGWTDFIADALFGGLRSLTRLFRTVIMWLSVALVADFLKKLFGIEQWIGYSIGFIIVFFLTWVFLLTRILLFFPFPSCQKGKCHSIDDYTWNMGSFLGHEGGGVYSYQCNCGDKYVRERKRFMKVLSDGTKRPYKKLVGFRKWADDLTPQKNN